MENLKVQLQSRIQAILGKVPAISSIVVRNEQFFLGRLADLSVSFDVEEKKMELIVEIKERITPKKAQEICSQWRNHFFADSKNIFPVIAAPYLSDASIDVCKENKVGCFDALGNCFIANGAMYVEIRGIPNPYPAQQTTQALFSPKSSRVSRVLLSDINKWWQIQGIAQEADISIGLVSTVKKQLLEERLIEEEGKSIRVKDPIKLIDCWLEKYSYKKNKRTEYYSLVSGPTFEKKFAAVCAEQGIKYAAALFSGANKIAPFVRMEKQFMYIEKEREAIAAAMNLKRVDSGANVIILEPYDDGVFYGSREKNGIQIVSELQLYLDLVKFKGRGEEAARAILQNILEPSWSQKMITSHKT